MKPYTLSLALVLGLAPLAAHAAKVPDMSHAVDPGEWSYTIDVNMQIGKMTVPARSVSEKKCVTQKELDKSKNWFANLNKNGHCTTKDLHYAGHVLTFTSICKQAGGELTIQGKMFLDSRTAYHGVIDTAGEIGGQKVQGHSTIKASRIGSCAAQETGR